MCAPSTPTGYFLDANKTKSDKIAVTLRYWPIKLPSTRDFSIEFQGFLMCCILITEIRDNFHSSSASSARAFVELFDMLEQLQKIRDANRTWIQLHTQILFFFSNFISLFFSIFFCIIFVMYMCNNFPFFRFSPLPLHL